MSRNEKQQALFEMLEAYTDANNLTDVLATLAEVCDAKAEHLASAWQDHVAAKAWQKAAQRVDNCAHTAAVVDVS